MHFNMTSTITSGEKNRETTFVPPKRERYLSLDVLRGLTIALMVMVNTPGSWSTIYAPFRHAAWHGFTITDLVFPSFLFVMGNAMSFSMRKFRQQPHSVFFQKVIKRTVLIFLIGLFLSAFPFVYWADGELVLKDFSRMRIMGVLQRIALCYFFASIFVRYLRVKGSVILGVIILLAYWGIMYYFGDPADPYSMKGNAALKFDLLIFNEANLWRGFGFPFDPEGLLSTLPAIVNVIAGYVAGVFIQKSGNTFSSVWKLVVAGLVLVGLGELWDLVFPINKPIWTSSYVLLSTGWTLVVLGLLIWIIEVLGQKRWTYFLEVFGKNPLFIFVMSGVVVMLMNLIRIGDTSLKGWLYNNLFLSWLGDYDASLLFSIAYMLLMWLIGYVMDKNKIYVKV